MFLGSRKFDDNVIAMFCGGDLGETFRQIHVRFRALPARKRKAAEHRLRMAAALCKKSELLTREFGMKVTLEQLEQDPVLASLFCGAKVPRPGGR